MAKEMKEVKISKEKDVKKRVYIAYGSNMDVCRMDKRCSNFEFFGTGYIFNYKLTFQQSVSGFYANIISSKAKKNFEYVPVVLYLISKNDEDNLDVFEGYPDAYKKTELEVELDDGSKVKGLAYVLPTSKSYGIPSIQYYRMIENAYKIFGFELDVLKNALVFSYRKAKNSINSKISKEVNRVSPKKEELTSVQNNFMSEFLSKNKSDWGLIRLNGDLALIKTKGKGKDKTFKIIINKDKSISLKDTKTGTLTTVESVDSLVKCCSIVED